MHHHVFKKFTILLLDNQKEGMGEAAITFSAQTIAFYERKNIASFNKIE